MIALIASFFSLCVGPLIYQTFGPLKRTDKIVGGIVLVIVVGIVSLEIIPQTYQDIGFLAIILATVGFAGPTFVENTFQKAASTTHKLTIYLGILGLIVHAFIDGAAIQTDQNSVNKGLTLAIVLHRLPVGLTIWWMLKPLLGERYALVTLLLMGLSTFAGYALSHAVADYSHNALFAFIQALIAGSLLHVVIHKPHSDGCMHTDEAHQHHHHTHKKRPTIHNLLFRWESLGYLIGLLVLGITQFNHL